MAGPQFELQAYTLDHAEGLLEAALESVVEVGPWLPWCHDGLKLGDVRTWIEKQIEDREKGLAYEFAIVSPENGRYLGGCGLNCVSQEHRLANLGYWVRTPLAGRGLVPRAVCKLAEWAFAETELERLEIVCAVENVRSQRAAEKTPAKREGILRRRFFLHGESHDAVVYSIVRSDLDPGA